MFFRGKKKREGGSATAVDPAELFAQIDKLTESNRAERDPAKERELRRLRHLAGIALVQAPVVNPPFPEPSPVAPARNPESGLPEITPEELTPEILRAAILDSGCLLVRGLMDQGTATGLANDIEKSFAVRT
ncbi:MAG: hypothetical protein WBP55_07540, partial [Solirubrobacterales bacterium]